MNLHDLDEGFHFLRGLHEVRGPQNGQGRGEALLDGRPTVEARGLLGGRHDLLKSWVLGILGEGGDCDKLEAFISHITYIYMSLQGDLKSQHV